MHRSTALWLLGSGLLGSGLTAYLLLWVSPFLPSGQLNLATLALLLMGLFLAITGAGGLLALLIHSRAPTRASRRRAPLMAVRQGILLALAVDLMVMLAIVKILDLAIACVILLVAGLAETFFQRRD